MRFTLLFTLFFVSIGMLRSQADYRCGYDFLISQKISENPDYAISRSNWDAEIAQNAQLQGQRSSEVYRIPVVFHVIYNNDEQNVPDEKILDQLAILNQDYNRLNPDTVNTRSEFLPVAAPAGIEFYLAQWDPQGNPTSGITRTQTDVASFINLQFDLNRMKSEATGGVSAWDVSHYMNIWVCNLSIPILNVPFVLGFATPPDGAPNWPAGSAAEQPDYDGVVLHYEVVGSNPDATGTFATINKGRTATHEVGHYLGLRHIWGDGQGADGCSVDDGLEDTPNCASAQQQTCDYTANSCDEGSGDLPDQIENYMDYSDENCMNMFTRDQVNAMRYVIENFRQDLLLSTPESTSNQSKLLVWPNPVEDLLYVEAGALKPNSQFQVIDLNGRVVLSGYGSSSGLSVSMLNPGLYALRIQNSGQSHSVRFFKR